jgi:translation initiation factor 2D
MENQGSTGKVGEKLMNSKTKLNPPSLLKSALDAYATKHHLFDRAEPRYLLLDEELGRACGVKKPEKGQKMSREEIMKKLRAGVVWQVSVNGVIK